MAKKATSKPLSFLLLKDQFLTNSGLVHLNRMWFCSIKESMEKKLKEHFTPTHLEINQEGKDKFQVIIESEKFAGQAILKRHREVNEVLKDEIAQIHAFSVVAKTPAKK
mmetsp:Transcript_8710/g.9898  ORF Transcript_8710/g.9898 Transcript_8710/m.9898 type:complete len:109 (-) Transcript_8710:17-343(-)